MPRRSDHTREELRELFVAAAEGLVRSSGPAALTARSVAQAVGYAPGTLYLVFRNLDDLVATLNGRTLDRLEVELSARSEPCAPGAARIRALALAYVGFARREPHLWRLVFEHRPKAGDAAQAGVAGRLDETVALIQREIAADLGPRASPAFTMRAARAAWGGVHGVTILSRDDRSGAGRPGDEDEAAAVAQLLVEAFLDGLKRLGAAPGS